MGGYELHNQLSEQFFRPAGGHFANFSSSVGSTSEEIYSQQAVYLSYTSDIVDRLVEGFGGADLDISYARDADGDDVMYIQLQ